jgi:hypothetical protein
MCRQVLKRIVRVAQAGVLLTGLFVFGTATPSFAATSAVNASTVSPTLQVTVTVQKAIQLTLAQGGAGSCAITAGSTPDYSMSFGNVDALGINNATCGTKIAPTTPGTTPSVYYTDYSLTPVFTNQSSSTASITAYVSSNFTLNSVLAVVQANSNPGGVIGNLSPMSTAVGSPTTIGASLASGTAIARWIGVTVAPANGVTAATDNATVTYTMTVP